MRNLITEIINKTPKEKKVLTEMLNNVHNKSARLVPFSYKKSVNLGLTKNDDIIETLKLFSKIDNNIKVFSRKDFQSKIKKDAIFEKNVENNRPILKKEYDYNYFESLDNFDDITLYKLINDRFGEKQFLKEMDMEYIINSKMKAIIFLIEFRKACESGSEEEIIKLVGDLNLNHEELRSVINDISIKMYQLACDQGYINSEKTNALSMFEKFLRKNEIEKPDNLIIHSSAAKSSSDAFKTLNECISAMKLAIANKNKGIFLSCDISQTEAIDYLASLDLKPAINSNIGSPHQTNFDIAVIDWQDSTYRFLDIKFTNLNQMSGRYNGPFVLHFGKLADQSKVDSVREFIKKNALLDLNFYLENYEGDERQDIVNELLNVIKSDDGLQRDLSFSDKAYLLYE